MRKQTQKRSEHLKNINLFLDYGLLMFDFQLTLCFETELISYVKGCKQIKVLVNVSNAGILFVDMSSADMWKF